MSKGLKRSSESAAGCPNVENIRQTQGSGVQKFKTVVELRGRVSKRVKRLSTSRVGCPEVLNIRQNHGSGVQECEPFVKNRGRVPRCLKHWPKSWVGCPKVRTLRQDQWSGVQTAPNSHQNQRSGVQKFKVFIKSRGLVSNSLKRPSKSGVGCPNVSNISKQH